MAPIRSCRRPRHARRVPRNLPRPADTHGNECTLSTASRDVSTGAHNGFPRTSAGPYDGSRLGAGTPTKRGHAPRNGVGRRSTVALTGTATARTSRGPGGWVTLATVIGLIGAMSLTLFGI